MITVVASDRFMGLSGGDVVHSIICIFIYMAALLYAVAKNDPHAHDKVEFKLKKRKWVIENQKIREFMKQTA